MYILSTNKGKTIKRVDNNNNKGKTIKRVDDNDNKINNINTLDVDSTGSVKIKLPKFRTLVLSKEAGSGFPTLRVRLTFTKLREAFIKALILHHFDLEYHIWIETNTLSYAICRILS